MVVSRREAGAKSKADLLRTLLLCVGYLSCYVLLDGLSYVEPLKPFNITPWSPQAGMTFALLLVTGLRFAPLAALAPLLSDLTVIRSPVPLPIALALSLINAASYAAAVHLLRTARPQFELALQRTGDILALVLAAGSGALVASLSYCGVLAATGWIPAGLFPEAALRYWVGDVIGIVVVAPFLILLSERRLRRPGIWDVVRLATILIAILLMFSLPIEQPRRLFYVLFLPIIWIALASGLEATIVGIFIAQLGLLTGLLLSVGFDAPVTSYQLLMLVLALTGLAMGAVVSERGRAERRLQRLYYAQARFDRMGSLGALSGTLTHEINQPLSAAATYTRLALDALPEGETAADARRHALRAAEQIKRAGSIVHRMRDLIVVGRSELAPVRPAELIAEAVRLLPPQAGGQAAAPRIEVAANLPLVMADPQQIGQVVINLVNNAYESVEAGGQGGGAIRIEVMRGQPGFVEFCVHDNGPGFEAEQLAAPLTPLVTTKPQGLGIGLALCKIIVDSHGGSLRLANDAEGAVVCFSLQEAKEAGARTLSG